MSMDAFIGYSKISNRACYSFPVSQCMTKYINARGTSSLLDTSGLRSHFYYSFSLLKIYFKGPITWKTHFAHMCIL